jgi:GNAT superfamily N-acetyltransferase
MRKWINLFENDGSLPREIMVRDDEHCFAAGVVFDAAGDELDEWFEDMMDDTFLAGKFRHYGIVAILYKVVVAEEKRGQGLGDSLLQRFIDEARAYGAEAILLEANTGERQNDGFDLVEWYEGWGFYTAIDREDPIMVKDL